MCSRMGNEQGSVLDRAPLNSPCELTWSQLKTEASMAGREGHCTAVINNKVSCQGIVTCKVTDKAVT